jgi:hypothetical protein
MAFFFSASAIALALPVRALLTALAPATVARRAPPKMPAVPKSAPAPVVAGTVGALGSTAETVECGTGWRKKRSRVSVKVFEGE